MPVLNTTAYVTLETITVLARAIVNDMIYSQSGEIMTDSANFEFPLVNDALQWFQNEVNNHGVETFTKETVLTPVTPIAGPNGPLNDPGAQVNISDTGYFNGQTNTLIPQIPSDLLEPEFLWERRTGSTEEWCEMTQCLDGLPSIPQGPRLGIWEWRGDAICMPGATQSNDLRLRFQSAHAVFATVNDTVLFRGGSGPIAYKLVSTYLMSKNPEAAQMAMAEANDRVSQLTTRNARMKQRDMITRISYGDARSGRRAPRIII